MDQAFFWAIFDRYHATAAFLLTVRSEPFVFGKPVQMRTERCVASHRECLTRIDMADVDRDLRVGMHIVDEVRSR